MKICSNSNVKSNSPSALGPNVWSLAVVCFVIVTNNVAQLAVMNEGKIDLKVIQRRQHKKLMLNKE